MFRTNRISEDTEDIYFILLQIFGKIAATKIMKFLLSNRTYNIQLIGSCGAGKSCFAQTLLTNTFPQRRSNVPVSGTIAFPTNLGKIVFNIKECRYPILQQNLDMLVRDEWANTDAFFVMFSHETTDPSLQCEAWIKKIRTILRRVDVPIVLVGLKCDVHNYNLKPNIPPLCAKYGIPYVELCSKDGTNMHSPFLALQDILRTSDRNICVDVPNIPTTPLLLPPPEEN